MEKIINIIMRRDELSRDEAKELVEETRDMILESPEYMAEEILMEELGLEIDYLIDLITG